MRQGTRARIRQERAEVEERRRHVDDYRAQCFVEMQRMHATLNEAKRLAIQGDWHGTERALWRLGLSQAHEAAWNAANPAR